MARARFLADYDHYWSASSVTAFKAGWEGTVKRSVLDAAIACGKAEDIGLPDDTPIELAPVIVEPEPEQEPQPPSELDPTDGA